MALGLSLKDLVGLWGEMEEHSRQRKGIELEVLTIMQLGS